MYSEWQSSMGRGWVKELGIALLAVTLLVGQSEQGSITGVVSDDSGAAVPGAVVQVTNVQTGTKRSSETNLSGVYAFPYLGPGTYEMSISKDGFERVSVKAITLTVGLTATVSHVLKPGSVQQEVTVNAQAVQLERQSATLGAVISAQQIIELPTLGRDAFSLTLLAPGVLPGANTATNAAATAVIGGGRSQTNQILLDGAETRNSVGNAMNYSPPLEAVGEFKVITNSFSSEFGRSGGGVISASTRSGTNILHGSLYEFFRNDKLNANGWTANRNGLGRSKLRHNEYGAALGGPIYLPRLYDGHNKTFFFVNAETIPERIPNNILATVPTALERAGDYSQTRTANGQAIQIYDPQTTRPNPAAAGQFIRDVFPGNRIPANRFDPIALKALTYYPLPNRDTIINNYVQNRSQENDLGRILMKVDHQLGQHHLFVTHGRQKGTQIIPPVNEAFPNEIVNVAANTDDGAHSTVLSDTVVFRPNLIGEFRGTLVRRVVVGTPSSFGFDYTQLGFPQSLKNLSTVLTFPFFEVADASSLGVDRGVYSNNTQQNSEFQAHFTWVKGSHTVKSGADYEFSIVNAFRYERPSGYYQFNRGFTQGPNPAAATQTGGYGTASLLLGLPAGGAFSFDPALATSQRLAAFYVQDDWKISRTLTVNLGLRYDYQTPWTERYDRLGTFEPTAIDPLTKRPGVIQFLGQGAPGRYQNNPDRNNIAPRLGLAWSLADKMVARAAYGVFYFPGNLGIGAGAAELGDGYLTQTPVFLGAPPAAPNTPPAGASIANAFQGGFFLPPSNGVGNNIRTAFRDLVTPFNHQWNFSLQRSLTQQMLVEVAYLGTRGQRIFVDRNRNSVQSSALALGAGLDQLVPNPFFNVISTGALSVPTIRASQLLRPFPQYQEITRFRDSIGDSIYHGMTLRVQQDFQAGLRFQVSYTVSKLIDNVQERFGGRSTYIDPNNLALSRSVGDYDRPQFLVVNGVYQLPLGHGKSVLSKGLTGRILGNWQVSGVGTFGKGLPIVISGPNNSRLPGVGAVAQRIKSPVLENPTLDRYFDTTAFAPAALYTLGNDSRTQPNLRTPGINSINFGIARIDTIRERIKLQIRGEFFNALNKTQFNGPNGSVTATTFGQITTAGAGRVVQLGARLSF